MSRTNMQFLLLQEVRWRGIGDKFEEQKRKFFSDLNKASKACNKHQKLIVAGELNATTGVAKY